MTDEIAAQYDEFCISIAENGQDREPDFDLHDAWDRWIRQWFMSEQHGTEDVSDEHLDWLFEKWLNARGLGKYEDYI